MRVETEVLTAVFFSLNDTALTPLSAVLSPGSRVFYDNDPVPDGQPAGGVVGGEWAYEPITTLGAGISSAGCRSGYFGRPSKKREQRSPARGKKAVGSEEGWCRRWDLNPH